MNLEIATSLCKVFEGFYSKPYLCPAGVWTVGYGTTYYESGRRVTQLDPPVTQERAEELLLWELGKVSASAVARMCPELLEDAVASNNWSRFNAIVDFTYNLGSGRLQTSTLRKRLRARDWDGAKQELVKWNRGGGRVLPGLVKRRAAECALL